MTRIQVRRSLRVDATRIENLIAEEQETYCERFSSEFNIPLLLEQSLLSVTVTDDEEFVVGFASFAIIPPGGTGLGPNEYPQLLSHAFAPLVGDGVPLPSTINSLWLVGFSARFDVERAALHECIRAAFATVHDALYLFHASPAAIPAFEPVASALTLSTTLTLASDATVRVSSCTRSSFVPTVRVRPGRVEDFDDLTSLVAAADDPTKRLTRVPPAFRLEALLEASVSGTTPGAMVLVATDATTDQPVGVACVASSPETQADLVRHYTLDPLGKLRRLIATDAQPPTGYARNSVHIVFMYVLPQYDAGAADMVAEVFASYPHVEFVTICAPHDVHDAAVLSKFSFVPLRSGATGRDALFVACRYAYDNPRVRPLLRSDAPGVKALLAAVPDIPTATHQAVSQALQEAPSAVPPSHSAACWVAEHRSTVVGLLVGRHLVSSEVAEIAREFELEDSVPLVCASLRSRYAASGVHPDAADERVARITAKALRIDALVVVPLFAPISRTFLLKVLAATGANALLCRAEGAATVPPTVAATLHPVAPRYSRVTVPDGTCSAAVGATAPTAVLFATSPRLLGDPRMRCWARIVVVGASATGLALLLALATCQYAHFANLVLVSRRGLPPPPSHNPADWNTLVADTVPLAPRELALLAQPSVLRVMADALHDFDRTEQLVVTEDSRVEGWDRLVLAVGRQAAVPRSLMAAPMPGVMAVKDDIADEVVRAVVAASAAGETTVVYGRSLDAVAALTKLCNTRGISHENLAWVIPPQNETCVMQHIFGDEDVYHKVRALFGVVGVKVYVDDAISALVTLTPDGESSDESDDGAGSQGGDSASGSSEGSAPASHEAMLLGVALASGAQIGTPDKRVGVVLCADDRDIDASVLTALSKRSIVFDGRVIVSATYRTADPRIFAAGPVAMFTRRIGPSAPFDTVSQRSVGFHVAAVLTRSLGYGNDDPAVAAAFAAAAAKAFGDTADDGSGGSRDVPMDPAADDVRLALSGHLTGELTPIPDVDRDGEPVLIPRYTGNVCARVCLPMGYLYYRCQRRGWAGATGDSGSHEIGSHRDVFHDTADGSCYISVTIDGAGTVFSVTFLGPAQQADIEAWSLLVGLPHTALSLVQMTDTGKAALAELLVSRPTIAVLTRRFHNLIASMVTLTHSFPEIRALRKRLREALLQRHADGGGGDGNAPDELFVGDLELRKAQSQLSETSRRALHLRVLRFLHDNDLFVGDLALPDIAAELERAMAQRI